MSVKYAARKDLIRIQTFLRYVEAIKAEDRIEAEEARREAEASGVRLFDVKYILGGREKDLEGRFVRLKSEVEGRW